MILVGIDTGVHTGVAIWKKKKKKFEKIYTTKIAKAMEDVLILHNATAEVNYPRIFSSWVVHKIIKIYCKIFCRYNYYYYICNIKQQTKI